jgi:hypothetical protein
VLLAGLKVRNGNKLDSLLRDAYKDLPTATKAGYAIRWGQERYAGARVHRVTRVGGQDLDGYLALRDDVVFLGLGKQGLAAVKDALDGFGKTAAAPTPLLRFDLRSSFFLENGPFREAVEKALSSAEWDGINVQISVHGGKDIRLRVTMGAYVLKYLATRVKTGK